MLPMVASAFDDKPSDTLVVGFGRRFWTGSSTLPHLHQTVHGAAPILTRRTGAVAIPGVEQLPEAAQRISRSRRPRIPARERSACPRSPARPRLGGSPERLQRDPEGSARERGRSQTNASAAPASCPSTARAPEREGRPRRPCELARARLDEPARVVAMLTTKDAVLAAARDAQAVDELERAMMALAALPDDPDVRRRAGGPFRALRCRHRVARAAHVARDQSLPRRVAEPGRRQLVVGRETTFRRRSWSHCPRPGRRRRCRDRR